MDDLWNIYNKVSLERSPTLEEFVDEVIAVRHGTFSNDEIIAFLHRMEEAIISNIEAMVEGNPDAAAVADESRMSASKDIARLVEKVKKEKGG